MSLPAEPFNQSLPLAGVNLFSANRPLREALAFHAPALSTDGLMKQGELCGSAEMQQQAVLANRFAPRLEQYDAAGHRIDEVQYHPAYHRLMDLF